MTTIHLKLGLVCIGKKKPICRRLPHSPNFLNTKHWGTKYAWKTAWQDEVWARWQEIKRLYKGIEFPLKKVTITPIVYCISPQDEDNFAGSLKPIFDGLRYAKVIEDDTPKHVNLKPPKYFLVHKRKEEHLELMIEVKQPN